MMARNNSNRVMNRFDIAPKNAAPSPLDFVFSKVTDSSFETFSDNSSAARMGKDGDRGNNENYRND
jgi:hypothetical protein